MQEYDEQLLEDEYDGCAGCYEYYELGNHMTLEPHVCVVRDDI